MKNKIRDILLNMTGRGWSIASDFRPVIRSTISSKRFESVSRLYIYIYRSNLAYYTYFIAARTYSTIRFANHWSLLTSCKEMIVTILFVNRHRRWREGKNRERKKKKKNYKEKKKIIRLIAVGGESKRIENWSRWKMTFPWIRELLFSSFRTYQVRNYVLSGS